MASGKGKLVDVYGERACGGGGVEGSVTALWCRFQWRMKRAMRKITVRLSFRSTGTGYNTEKE